MASKAYVASMTVTELKQELKQRGLSTRGSKKNLRDRLERAFDEEELNDSSSESDSEGNPGPLEAGFNFSVPAESFLPPDQIREDSPVMSPEQDKMIISVELSNKETLEVYSPKPPPVSTVEDKGGGGGGPLVVAVAVPNDEGLVAERGTQRSENHNSFPAVSTAVASRENVEMSGEEKEAPPAVMTDCVNDVSETQPSAVEHSSNAVSTDAKQVLEPPLTAASETEEKTKVEALDKEVGEEGAGLTAGEGGERGGGDIREENEGVGGVGPQVEEGEGREVAENESGLPSVAREEGAEDVPVQSAATGEAKTTLQVESKVSAIGEGRGSQSVEEVEKSTSDEQATNQGGEEEGGDGDEWVIIERPPPVEEDKNSGGGGGEASKPPVDECVPTEGEPEVSSKSLQMKEEEEGEGTTAEPVEVGEKETDAVEQGMEVEKEEDEEVEGEDIAEDQQMQQEERSPPGEEKVQGSSTTADVPESVPMEDQGQQPTTQITLRTTATVERETTAGEEESVQQTAPEEQAGDGAQHEEQVESVERAEEKVQQESQAEAVVERAQPQNQPGAVELSPPSQVQSELAEEMMQQEEQTGPTQGSAQPQEQAGPTQERVQHEKQAETGPAEEQVISGQSTTQEERGGVQEEIVPTEPTTATTSPHSPTKQLNDTTSDTSPPKTAAEEVSEGVNMEVAVLVHAEEDDLSVFSTEAAEAQKIASSREKERGSGGSSSGGKARERARDKDRDKLSSSSAKHRHTSGLSAAGLPHPPSSSSSSAGLVGESAGSDPSRGSGSEAGKADTAAASKSSPAVETKHAEGDRAENQAEPPSKKRRRISAHASSSSSSLGAEPASIQWGGGGERKRRWGSGKQRSGSSTTNISSDILKDIIPSELEVGEGVMVEGEGGEEGSGEMTDLTSGPDNLEGTDKKDEHQLEWEEKVRQREAKQREAEWARQELETRQRIAARVRARLEQADVKEKELGKESDKRRSPSPACSPPSNILHVKNLTRPFTLTQLRQLLAADGPLLKDGFWTNGVKSHCIAVYGSKGVATTTRQRLHGLKWPSTNPKLMSVDFLSPEEVKKISEGDLVVMTAPPPPEVSGKGDEEGEVGGGEEEEERGSGGDVGETGEGVREEGEEEREQEKPGKRRRESSGQEKVEEDRENEIKSKNAGEVSGGPSGDVSSSDPVPPAVPLPPEKAPSQATKLLDDLFRKTKATPSIYWLPLSEAEVQVRQQEREAKEAEREKRRQERQRAYEEERKKEREREKEREEMAKKERERRIQEERERRARERVRRRSRSGDSRSRSRSKSHDRYRDRDRRRR